MNIFSKNIAKFLFTALFLLGTLFVAPIATSQLAYAHNCGGHNGEPLVIAECVDAGACLDSTGANCPAQSSNTSKINTALKLVINMFSILVGFVAVIMIIVGGLKYVTSSGDTNNISSAKNTILYAVIGLVIVALAQILVKFVLSKAKV